ncbi:hypothetical protein ASPZODRAFT_74517 [Penicilliopsis zonata CBS 506.65]|uniref:VOC domain-containing protein n=1 Tax=Penicilliopsis zonata CBS 506.65 TaxID=1073090 RepID=A0A1L9S8B4_9EURO|nr:hypothetical protein ASPZODRAFT_74517 [Penicilliopsis zonata CBS 506.65]OJJ43394.1 hypothetical protein ASPZODRAFT_74517 [Penicilliopsis zonata CBS 506.65]
MPVSHLTLTVSHLPTSTSFFLSCLQPLGYQFIGRHDDYIGFGQKPGEPADFWITEQKPGTPAGATHVAFPAPSKDAVGSFFICALKAGGKIHGEPKTRDSDSGYYSAAVIDVDGNSIEAVYRPPTSAAKSVVSSGPALNLIENGSVVSRATSKVSSVKTESIAPPRSVAKSSYYSKAPTVVERAVERAAPTVVSREVKAPSVAPSAPSTSTTTYNIYHQTLQQQQPQPKSDDGSTVAKTIVGTLLGAAAGAAIAYAMVKGDSQSETSSQTAPPEYTPQDLPRLLASTASQTLSQVQSQAQAPPMFQAIEAAPARSTYSRQQDAASTYSRSVMSKNPRADTIYEGTEFYPPPNQTRSVYLDENGRRSSEGSVYSSTRELPLRAIEYPPSVTRSQSFPCNPSTFISSYHEPAQENFERGSTYTASTIKAASKAYDDGRSSHHSSHHSVAKSLANNSTASSTRTARQIPLPEGSVASSYRSTATASNKSGVSARHIPHPPQSMAGSAAIFPDTLDVDSYVSPADSVSQIGDSRRSSAPSIHSHSPSHAARSLHSSHSKAADSHVSKRSSRFDEPVRPSDSISQVSSHASRVSHASHASQQTVKASGSVAPSKASRASRSQA